MSRLLRYCMAFALCMIAANLNAQQLCTQIQDSDHDAEERSDGRVSTSSSDLEMAYDKSNQIIGLYFENPGLSSTATVSQSQITFVVDETTDDATSLRIYAQLSNNAVPFERDEENISSRPRTQSFVQWNPGPWENREDAHKTPDLSSILNELAALQGFSSESPIVLLIEGTGERVAESYDGESELAPELCFTTGGTPPTTNQPPAFTSNAPTSGIVGSPYSYTPTVSDPDTNAPVIRATVKPSWLNFSNGTLSGSPSLAGIYGVTLSVTDGTSTVTQIFNITVANAPVTPNDPPEFTNSAPTSITAGNNYQHTFTADDPENNPLTFASVSIPGWLSMSGATLSGSPSASDAGVHAVTVSVRDAFNSAVNLSFNITVVAVVTPPTGGSGTVTVCSKIAKESDDAEQRSNGSLSTGSSDLEMIYDKSDQLVGLRFEDLNIPAGAQVSAAYVQFQADETTDGNTQLNFRGEISSNPDTFSSGNDIASRNLGNAVATWNPPAWNNKDDRGNDQKSVNLAAVINEVVNSSSYSMGDAIVLVIDGSGERVAEAFDGDEDGAAELCVSYSSTPDTEAPTAPINLSANSISSNSIGLSWVAGTDNVGVSSYLVFRNGTQVGTTSNTNYTASGLASSTTYQFYVVSEDLAGLQSGQSNNISAATTSQPVCALPQVNAIAFCEDGTTNRFYINVTLSGGAGTFTLTNSGNSSSETVGAGSSTQIGPFNNNASIDLNLVSTAISSCSLQFADISTTCFVPGTGGGSSCETITGFSRIGKLDVGDYLGDNEGMSYIPSDDVFWIADDNQDAAVCVDLQGNLVRKITQDSFKAARNLHDGSSPGTSRTEDIEAAAYDGNNDILYMFSGKCCPNEPAAYRLMRDGNGDFQVESWVRLSSPNNDFTGAAYHPTEGLFVGSEDEIKSWDYETNTASVEFRVPNGHDVYGMGFSEDGNFLWLAVDKTDVIRIDWRTKQIVNEISTKSQFDIADSRAVEQVGNLLYVCDGNSDLAISVFELECSSSRPTAKPAPVFAERVVTEDGVDLFPNPTNSILNVQLRGNEATAFSYKLISNNGQVLDVGSSANTHLELNLSKYAKGVYFLQMMTEDGSFTSHPILKK